MGSYAPAPFVLISTHLYCAKDTRCHRPDRLHYLNFPIQSLEEAEDHDIKKERRHMIKKSTPLLPALTALMVLTPVPHALAENVTQESVSEGNTSIESIENNLDCSAGEGQIVTDSSGNQHYLKCLVLDGESDGLTFYNHWSPYEDAYFRCGSSYVRNQQIAWYHYRGTVHASGEFGSDASCGGSGKVTAASITYKRDGEILGQATAGTGETRTAHAWDSVKPNHAPTEMYYDFTLS